MYYYDKCVPNGRFSIKKRIPLVGFERDSCGFHAVIYCCQIIIFFFI